MKVHVFTSRRAALTHLLSQMNKVVRWDQLAQSYYRHHVRRTRFYLWRSALLMVVALACCAWLLLGGPKILITPAVVIPLMLIVLRVDRKVSLHFRAAAEYRLSVAEFESLSGTGGLPGAISKFEERCRTYGPSETVALKAAVSHGWPTPQD